MARVSKYNGFDIFLCFFMFFPQHILLVNEIRGAYVAGSLCFILVYFFYFFQHRTFRKLAFTFPMLVWIALNAYHIINGMYKNSPTIDYYDWFHAYKPYAGMVVVCYWCMLDFKKTIRTLCIVYALLLLFFLFSGFDTLSEGEGRLSSTVAAVSIGHYAGVLSLFIAFYSLMNKVSIVNTMLMFAFALAFTFFSQGRVSMIMILFSVLAYAYTYVKTGGRAAMSRGAQIILFGVVGLVFLLTIYENSGLSRRVSQGRDYQLGYFYEHNEVNPIIDRIVGDRVVYYYYGWQFFKQNPWTGIGLENYKPMTGGEYPIHSDYMVNLAEGGIVAFSLYLIFYFYIIYNLWKIPKTEKYKYVTISGLVTLLVIAIWTGVFRFETYCPIYGIILYIIYKNNGIIKLTHSNKRRIIQRT